MKENDIFQKKEGGDMEGFRSAAGQLHMLFADEDEYYTDSLVRMDREAYIDYCLQRAG